VIELEKFFTLKQKESEARAPLSLPAVAIYRQCPSCISQ
jgi:hypothetical protein